MSATPDLTFIDLFCGAGGFTEGFKRAGFQPLLGIDNSKDAVATYSNIHGNGLMADISKITLNNIKAKTNRERIDVVIGGPPCQGFSVAAAGKLKIFRSNHSLLDNPLNLLYKQFVRMIRLIEPTYFIMENVRGMISIENGAVKKNIMSILSRNYDINFYDYNAANFGVPQNRKRALIVGKIKKMSEVEIEATHGALVQHQHLSGVKPYETVKSAISDLPFLKSGEGNQFYEYENKAKTPYQRARRAGSIGVAGHVARAHNERDLRLFSMLKPGQDLSDLPSRLNPYKRRRSIFKDKYKKQPWNAPSSTILAHLSKDGLMFIHPDARQNRSFTPREAARLQSFDDSYVFSGSRTSQYIQIGNAVPPLFAMAIARAVAASYLSS